MIRPDPIVTTGSASGPHSGLLSPRLVAGLVLTWILLDSSRLPGLPTTNGESAGVIVEQSTTGFVAEKAGIRDGDLLMSWERLNSSGGPAGSRRAVFNSPFDVREAEIEEAAHGAIAIRVLRGKDQIVFNVPEGDWRVTARPHFGAPARTRYERGLTLLGGQQIDEGLGQWGRLAGNLSRAGDHMDAAWLYSRIAAEYGKGRRWDEATASFDEAIQEANAGRHSTASPLLWLSFGHLLEEAGRLPDASKAYLRVIDVIGPDRARTLLAATALSGAARVARKQGRLDDSLVMQERAHALRKGQAAGSLAEAESLNELSILRRVRGEGALARSLAHQALAIQERLAPESLDLARTLNNLGALEDDDVVAERDHRRALAIRRRLEPDSEEVAASLSNLAVAVEGRGDVLEAEALSLEAVRIDERINPDGLGASVTLMNLGRSAHERNELALADAYYRRAIAIQERVAPESLDFALTLQNAGDLAQSQERLDLAESLYRRALAIGEKTNSRRLRINCFLRLGDVAMLREDYAMAEDLFRRAEKVATRRPGGSGITLRLARVAAKRGDVAGAEALLDQAFKDVDRGNAPSVTAAEILHNLAILYRDTGRPQQAADLLLRALTMLETLRHQQGRSKQASDYEFYATYYRECTSLLAGLRRNADALDVLERSRAAGMAAILAERDLLFENDVPSDLVRQRRDTNSKYDEVQSQLMRLDPQKESAKVNELSTSLMSLREQQLQIVDKMRAASSRYAALQFPAPADLARMRVTLDPGTLFLSYSIGKDRSLLFVLSPDTMPGPVLSVFTIPQGETVLRESVEAFRNLIERNSDSPELVHRGRLLYDALLKPAEPLMAKSGRLLILPDGPLHTVPWAALVRDVTNGKPQHLVEWKPIHTAISATVYAELKKARRQPTTPPPIEIAGFGDPRYPSLPAKKGVRTRGDIEEAAGTPLPGDEFDSIEDPQLRSVARGGFRLDPLPASRKEVEEIASLYAPRSVMYLGSDATEERAKSIGRDVPIIHFATHAIINERFPLDSALVFTIPDHPKEGQDNGLLQAWEIFEQMRIDADLVTLSACDSGLGKEIGGEGLIGLVRAFQYAGARSVLASLWKVEDKATAELMKRFYTYLKAGKTKDEALRSAQIDLIHSAKYSHPKDWAPFQLNGDWK